MLSDRFSLLGFGHRSPYILLGLLTQLVCFLILPRIMLPADLNIFFAVAMAAAVSMSLYDTCTDGLAVEVTPEKDRALVQGVMVGARAAGILTALLLGGWLISHHDWSSVFLMVSALGLPALLLNLVNWQTSTGPGSQAFDWSAFRSLVGREALFVAAMGLIYALALDGVLSYLSYHPLAGSVVDVGLVSGLIALSMLGRIAGAVSSAGLTTRFGYRASLALAIGLSALACYGLSLPLGTRGLAAACFLFGFSYGYYTAAYSAVSMALSDPRVAAAMFAVFMMFLNIGIALGQAIGGVIVEAGGFATLAGWMSLLVLLNLLLVRGLRTV
jgi:predicted MFS family arabinose efflux permease